MQICFASQNQNKVTEINRLLGQNIDILSLKDLNIDEEIAETGATLAENALIKAKYVFDKTGITCFADDTGLEVKALNGAPGVYSARYAGEPTNSENNITKLLAELAEFKDRSARFKTVIALYDGKEPHFFEGRVDGMITVERTGADGFGYDPVFLPNGFDRTFAEMTIEDKNSISHRGQAVRALVDFIKA